ncbi:TIGR02391 family protein [Geodermatophilus sp. URMC 63]
MDVAFAHERLLAYLKLLNLYRNPLSIALSTKVNMPGVDDLVIREQPTAMTLLAACGEPVTRHGADEATRDEHRPAVLRALGKVRDLEALSRALRTEVPALAARDLHPWVWEIAAPLWASGHRRQAVAAAAGHLSLKVQSKLDRWDVAADALMTEALSEKPPLPGKPRLRVPATAGRRFEEALQPGVVAYARGVFSLLRNPATHNVMEEWGEQRALEALAALSILARVLDSATVERAVQ